MLKIKFRMKLRILIFGFGVFARCVRQVCRRRFGTAVGPIFNNRLPKRRQKIYVTHHAKPPKPKISIHSTVKVENQES
jgi:hypothetical protein